ncbi:MAG: glycosyltransferase family 2 protein, partial [Verrucomicrobiota bacterium]
MSEVKLSVVLPVRGGGVTLGRALGSCLGQSFGDLELLLVDDGMDAGARSMVEEAGRGDERVRVLANEGRGLVSALNTGLEAARGELIGRMDADDVSDGERFAQQTEYWRERPEVGVVGCGVKITG